MAKKGADSSRKRNNKTITLEIEAIETPRGLVPTVSSINSLVQALNTVLETIAKMIGEIMEGLKKNAEYMEKIVNNIRSLDAKIDVMQSLLMEIKINLEKDARKTSVRRLPDNKKKDIKKDLLGLLKE